ncbi:PAS domain S-box protein, partial [Chloroflexota bacterium]
MVVFYVVNLQRKMVQTSLETERRFQQLYEQASLGHIMLAMDSTILETNQAWLDITGYERGAMIDRQLVDLIVPAEQEAFRQQFALLQKQGWWQDIELPIKRQNGNTITIRIDGEMVSHDQPQVVQCIVQDISRHKRTKNTLARMGRQSRLLLEAAGDGICGLDSDGNIIFMNPAAEFILGYDTDALMWRSFHETVYHSQPDGTPYTVKTSPIINTLRNGERHIGKLAYFWHKNGNRVPVEFISTAIQEGERIVGAVITFQDISDRLMQEEALQDSEARYSSLFNTNKSVIVIIDPLTGQIIDFNQAACDFYGYDRAYLITLRIHDLTVRAESEILSTLQKAQAFPGLRVESRHRLSNGLERAVEVYTGTVEIGGKSLQYGI